MGWTLELAGLVPGLLRWMVRGPPAHVEDLDMETSVLELIFLVGGSWNIRRLIYAASHRVTTCTQLEEDYLLQLPEK